MHSICARCQRHVSPRVHQDFAGNPCASLATPYFQYRQRKLKQFTRSQIFFAYLYVIDPEPHLITDRFEQRTKSTKRFPVCDIVPLHGFEAFAYPTFILKTSNCVSPPQATTGIYAPAKDPLY